MNQDVKPAPAFFDLTKDIGNLRIRLDITGKKEFRLGGVYQLANFVLKAAPLVRQVSNAQGSTRLMQLLGNAPGNGAVVGNTRNKSFFTREV